PTACKRSRNRYRKRFHIALQHRAHPREPPPDSLSPTPGGTVSKPQSLTQLFALDSLLEPEEIAIRDTVRKFGEERIRPHIAEWFEKAQLPARELAEQLGELGVLGMHLEGYDCA